MLPKVMMLDLDDTIISFNSGSETAWINVCNEFCKRKNFAEPDIILSAINEYRKWYWSDRERHRIGRNNMNAARRDIVTGAFTKLGIVNQEYAFEIADNYSKIRLENLELFPKAAETLETFKKSGIILALITNGDAFSQRFKIDKFKLEKFFDIILIEGELGFGKPDARIYEKALNTLGITPKDAWMAGDNLEWDVEAPQKLGVYSIWVDFKKQGLPVGSPVKPDKIIYGISELL